MKFSEKLQQLLSEQGLTGYAVSKGTGLPKSTISRILNGEASNPRSSTLAEIAAFLGITTIELTNGTNLQESYSRKLGKIKKGLRVPLLDSPTEAAYFSAIEGDVPVGSDFLPPTPFSNDNNNELIAIPMNSEALSPRIKIGDIVYFDTHITEPDSEFKAKNGDVVIAFPDNTGCAVIREFYKDDLGKAWLRATNPSWPGDKAVPCNPSKDLAGIAVSFAAKL